MIDSGDTRPFAQVLEDYVRLEPDEGDTWNPLHCEVELLHRAELFKRLTWALRAAKVDAAALQVLDVGCGNGRSTRMYLDLGLRPDQVTGIDLRAGAIARARATHPGIAYVLHDGGRLPYDEAAFDWISLCTVLSSVRDPDERAMLGADVTRLLRPGGYVFFWDLRRANDFAGGDPLRTDRIFPDLERIQAWPAVIDGFEEREADASGRVATPIDPAPEASLPEPTHDGILLRR